MANTINQVFRVIGKERTFETIKEGIWSGKKKPDVVDN